MQGKGIMSWNRGARKARRAHSFSAISAFSAVSSLRGADAVASRSSGAPMPAICSESPLLAARAGDRRRTSTRSRSRGASRPTASARGPEYKLEGTPLMVNGVLYTTAGTRRSVVALDAATGELRWAHSEREGARAAASPRQLSGRGVAYWTDGRSDERILYVTTGYRLVALDAKTGARIPVVRQGRHRRSEGRRGVRQGPADRSRGRGDRAARDAGRDARTAS
mgnify:CR=1 FL=1